MSLAFEDGAESDNKHIYEAPEANENNNIDKIVPREMTFKTEIKKCP